jgi:two-component system, OmpR family, phosphate regulon sensor histidine kinase PhoR
MTRFGFLLGVLSVAIAALLITTAYSSGTSRWSAVAGAALLSGLVVGLLLGRQAIRRRAPHTNNQEILLSDAGIIDFSPKLLDATINEMREGLLVIDQEMRVVASNRAARSLFSNVEDPIGARRLTELTRNPAIYDAFLDGVRGKERAGVKVETYGGERRVFDLRVVPLQSASGKTSHGAVGVFFDITRLERLELIRQEFLSNVSHELRTPLTSIIALAETLETGAIDNPEHNRRFLTIIQKNAARMHRLIDDILELSAIEAGNVKVKQEVVQLHPLVEDVVGSLSAAAATQAITLQNLVPQEAKVFADPHRLVQMLTNLIDNAIKFNREGGVVSIKCEGGVRDKISVEDTGEGIPTHHLDRLFERFYRVDRARSRELGGTGLGLAIVKHLARAHDGEVTVESRFGEGTRFTIELPGKVPARDEQSSSHTIALTLN